MKGIKTTYLVIEIEKEEEVGLVVLTVSVNAITQKFIFRPEEMKPNEGYATFLLGGVPVILAILDRFVFMEQTDLERIWKKHLAIGRDWTAETVIEAIERWQINKQAFIHLFGEEVYQKRTKESWEVIEPFYKNLGYDTPKEN